MSKLFSDIDQYLEQISDNDPVTAEGLDDLIYKIIVHTGLNYESCKILVKNYFQEIRNAMLRGDIVYLNNIGKLYIRCPKNGTSKRNVVPIIKPFKNLLNKVKFDD